MGSEPDSSSDPTTVMTPKLSLFSLPPILHPPPSDEPPGMLTPPLRPPASVPFLWEEAPGKPFRTSTTTTTAEYKCLELPPRLLLTDYTHNQAMKMTNMPSPTTVLDGPYRVVGRSASYSAVFSREPRIRSLKSSYGGSPPRDHHFHQDHGKSSSNYWRVMKGSSRGFNNYFFKGTSKVNLEEDTSVISPCGGGGGEEMAVMGGGAKVKISRSRRNNGSFLSLSNTTRNKTHLWASLFGSLKQAVPWKSKKAKN